MSSNPQSSVASGRLVSIDALRGFDMFWIIGGGTVFASLAEIFPQPIFKTIQTQLEHVGWEGFRFEDLIFPLFLFIVGVVMPFSMARRKQEGGRAAVIVHIIYRAAVLILIGMILNGLLKFDWPNMRWPGVLQRIGLCYGIAALIVFFTEWRTQAVVFVVILLAYWAVSMLVPVPGFPAGDITPKGCLSSWIDQQLIPGRFCCYRFGDNEGLISSFPAVCTALLGALAGHWLRSARSGHQKALGLLVAGLVCVPLGYAWGQVFPIIKNIWTSSFVLFAGGWSLLLLAAFYWIIDVLGLKKWAFFFVVIGANPITIYILQHLVSFDDFAAVFLTGIAKNAGAWQPIVMPLGVITASWLLLFFLYRHKIFFKV
jgi:predicted acyltransferase